MEVVLLAGGLGTRLSEETQVKPKPMVEIGGMPILWHIMKIYAHHGFSDFTVALGYKGDVIKDYFMNYHARRSDLRIELGSGNVGFSNAACENWTINLIDTGKDTLTGGRLHRLESRLRPTGTFMLTYGDGVANIDVKKLLAFHKAHKKLATVTAVRPPARFGAMSFNGDLVTSFQEKPQVGEGWINGGFFVFEPEVFDYLDGDSTILERRPLERLASDGQLLGFRHEGFWHPMDTIRDKDFLNEEWSKGRAPWKIWS